MERESNGECTHRDCTSERGFRVHWPGKTSELCPAHARMAAALADAMGFELTIDALPGYRIGGAARDVIVSRHGVSSCPHVDCGGHVDLPELPEALKHARGWIGVRCARCNSRLCWWPARRIVTRYGAPRWELRRERRRDHGRREARSAENV